ncbi:helix-turn-helix domain-containing protein [Myxococcota bacterium]|nr:helix-turn-helix domain-containing protein [Myxococcota bacterium]
MIRNEVEYRESVSRLQAERERMAAYLDDLQKKGVSEAEIKRVIDPLRSFHDQLAEEVASYERLLRGEFWELVNFDGLGRLLIALRIASGVTQRQLAQRLGVHESQVSRDERNEYHGATMDRVRRVLDALHVELKSVVTASEVTHTAG